MNKVKIIHKSIGEEKSSPFFWPLVGVVPLKTNQEPCSTDGGPLL